MTSDLVQTILHKRGITDVQETEKFLKPDFARDMHDPFLLHDMERAVVRVCAAMAAGEKIEIYSDFDCDGIPGAAVLHDFFKKIGYENFEVYIPHRDREGYGFHQDAVDKLHKQGVALIITVDVGGAAVDTVAYAKKLGIDVIICDHHEVTNGIPAAVAVVNPKLGEYPFKDLCGAAVAWKLVQALVREGKHLKYPVFEGLPQGWEKWLLDLVAIATIADMVPLVGENRTLTHFGLTVLRKSRRPGVKALCSAARLRQGGLTEDDIAFSFAPRINAASRMDEPEIALKLLTTKDVGEAEKCAEHLESLNRKRRGAVAAIVREAKARVGARYPKEDRVVVLGDTQWRPALMGLAANSIMEDRGGVVVMWGRDANGNLKGSARSDGSISVVELFGKASDALIEFGGHHASAGFSVSHEAVHTLQEVLALAASQLEARVIEKREPHDALVSLAEISWPLYKEICLLAPFGIGNPKPVLRVTRTSIASMRTFGKESNHVEVQLRCTQSGASLRSFDFFRTPTSFREIPHVGGEADILATIVHDTFLGGNSLALRLIDIVQS